MDIGVNRIPVVVTAIFLWGYQFTNDFCNGIIIYYTDEGETRPVLVKTRRSACDSREPGIGVHI